MSQLGKLFGFINANILQHDNIEVTEYLNMREYANWNDLIWLFGKKRPYFTTFLIATLFFLLSIVTTNAFSNLLTVGEPPTALPTDPIELDEQEQPTTIDASSFLYLPLVNTPNLCNLNTQEQAIAQLAMSDNNQGRPTMACDPILSQVARERAMDMAQRAYFGHTNPDGHGPNYLVRQAGYGLPTWYSNAQDGNNIESIAAGYTTADSVWSAWLASSGHRTHVLAESSFWQSQTQYGIGYYYDPSSPYTHYWVFLSAPPEE